MPQVHTFMHFIDYFVLFIDFYMLQIWQFQFKTKCQGIMKVCTKCMGWNGDTTLIWKREVNIKLKDPKIHIQS